VLPLQETCVRLQELVIGLSGIDLLQVGTIHGFESYPASPAGVKRDGCDLSILCFLYFYWTVVPRMVLHDSSKHPGDCTICCTLVDPNTGHLPQTHIEARNT
jgi:hypothetical protein